MFKKNDWLFGLVSTLIGLFVLANVRGLWKVKTSMDPAGPAALPSIIAWAMIGIGVVHIVASLIVIQREKKGDSRESTRRKGIKSLKPVLLITLSSMVFIFCLPFIGYPIAMPLLIGAVMFSIGVRDFRKIALTAISTAFILFVSFSYGLKVDLPLGILERFF